MYTYSVSWVNEVAEIRMSEAAADNARGAATAGQQTAADTDTITRLKICAGNRTTHSESFKIFRLSICSREFELGIFHKGVKTTCGVLCSKLGLAEGATLKTFRSSKRGPIVDAEALAELVLSAGAEACRAYGCTVEHTKEDNILVIWADVPAGRRAKLPHVFINGN